jgi:hypothetical protein
MTTDPFAQEAKLKVLKMERRLFKLTASIRKLQAEAERLYEYVLDEDETLDRWMEIIEGVDSKPGFIKESLKNSSDLFFQEFETEKEKVDKAIDAVRKMQAKVEKLQEYIIHKH